MKKIILGLIVLVIVATPCFAQEMEPEGLFSLNGTVWNSCYLLIGFPLAFAFPDIIVSCEERGMAYYKGKVYFCDDASSPDDCNLLEGPLLHYFYIDLGVVSIVFGISLFNYELAILQPIGLGYFTYGAFNCWLDYCGFVYVNGIMYKVNDNWTPPEIE